MTKLNPRQIAKKVKFKYNNITGTFRNDLGQEKSATEANKSNEKIEAQIARRKAYYLKLWDLDPKKKGPQYVGIRKYTYPEVKKVIPKVDVESISKGINNYMELTKKMKKLNVQKTLIGNFVIPIWIKV